MRKILLYAVFAACIASFAACSGSSEKKFAVTPPDGSLDPCTLRFSWWGGDDRHDATLKAVNLWEERHPDIRIITEYGGWDGWTEKTNTQISSGTAPDIMQINYDWLVNVSADGLGFYDLSKLTDHLDLSGFSDDILSFGSMNGHLNAVAVSMCGRGLFYNSEVYKRLGAEYPETWDDLFALGEKFSQEDIYPIDLDIQSGGTAWYLAVVYVQQQTGKEFITMDGRLGFTAEDIQTALDFYKKLEDSGVIRSVRTRTDEDGNAALYQSPEFISGRVAGVLEWGSAISKYESVLGSGILESGSLLTDGGGNSDGWMIKPSLLYALSSGTKYPDESAAFMDFLLNDKDCAELLGTTRGIPASASAHERLDEKGMLSGLAFENTEMLEKADTVTISPYMELSRMKEFYNEAVEDVSYGRSDTKTAAEKMYASVSQYLEKLNK